MDTKEPLLRSDWTIYRGGGLVFNRAEDCTVEDCLIRHVGLVEKQAAGVQISMSQGITIRHCSIYDTSRAGINVSEGTFGGHLIEFCDVFDTVQETGDHGSFNSWGRDRFWGLHKAPGIALPQLAVLDAVKPTIIRNSRWRCDHGWDVDLDDGSSNYEIYENLFLHGGLKLREGFHRRVWNNITVGNSLHPHVWYDGSGDVVTRNIWMASYRPAQMPKGKWGQEIDHNLFTTSDDDRTRVAANGCDAHSVIGDPLFIDAATGDYRVKELTGEAVRTIADLRRRQDAAAGRPLTIGGVDIAAVTTWSFNQDGRRGAQRFALFGSDAASDPGWGGGGLTPIAEVDTTGDPAERFAATSVRRSGGRPLGTFRWLVWITQPATSAPAPASNAISVSLPASGSIPASQL